MIERGNLMLRNRIFEFRTYGAYNLSAARAGYPELATAKRAYARSASAFASDTGPHLRTQIRPRAQERQGQKRHRVAWSASPLS